MTNFDTRVTVKSGEPLLITVPLKAKFYNPAGSASVTDINPAELTKPTSFVTIAKQSGNIPVYPNNGDENYYYIEGSNLIFSLAPLPSGTHSLNFQAFLKNAYFSCIVAIDAKMDTETTEVTTETLNIDAIGDGQGDTPPTNYIETQTSLPTGLTAEDLNRHCIVDNQLYKVVQNGSDYVWQKIKNLYSNVILFGYGSWIMTDEHGVEISGFDWRKPDGTAIAWNEVSNYIFNEIVTRQTHTTAMSGLPQEAKGWQVQESLYICMQDTIRNTYNLLFELQSVFFNGSKGWSATCLERSIEANSSGFERSITQTFHMFYEPTYAPDGRLTKDVIYGDVMVANDLPDPRDIHLGKCAIVGNKLYKCSNVSGSYQWVEVPIGKDNVIIDVTTLPTTDIQTESLYRVAGQVFYEGTNVTEFGLYKFTEHGIANGCEADADSITVLDGINQPITYSWEDFGSREILNNIEYSHSIEKTLVPTEANFALIDSLPENPGTSKSNIARHISVCEIIPSKLYHYKDNAWIQIQPTTDTALTTTDKTIVGAINELNTNKAPMDAVKHSGRSTLSASHLWDMSETATSEMKIRTSGENIPVIGSIAYGTMLIIERRGDEGQISQVFIEFYANRDTIAGSPLETPFNKYVKFGILPGAYNGAFATNFSNITWSEWQRVEEGEHNTLNAATTGFITDLNQCIFPVIGTRGNRVFRDSKLYAVSFQDPIANSSFEGECETVEFTKTNELIVEQTVTLRDYTTATRRAVFKRIGSYQFSSASGAWDNAAVIAGITWGAWFPVEYPQISLTLNTGWVGNLRFSITGGIATLYFVNLAKTSSATSSFPINSSSASGAGLIALPIKYEVLGTIYKTDNMTLVKALWRQNEGLKVSTNIVLDAQYLGTIHIPLGY